MEVVLEAVLRLRAKNPLAFAAAHEENGGVVIVWVSLFEVFDFDRLAEGLELRVLHADLRVVDLEVGVLRKLIGEELPVRLVVDSLRVPKQVHVHVAALLLQPAKRRVPVLRVDAIVSEGGSENNR